MIYTIMGCRYHILTAYKKRGLLERGALFSKSDSILGGVDMSTTCYHRLKRLDKRLETLELI